VHAKIMQALLYVILFIMVSSVAKVAAIGQPGMIQ
jgi:hypothetical protein